MTNKLTIRIDKNSIFYFFAIIPFVPIDYLTYRIPIWSTICSYARILIIALLLLKLIVIRRRLTIAFWLAILFFVAAFFSTYISDAGFYVLVYDSTYLFGFILLIDDGIYFDVDAFINGCLLWYEILIYANLIYFIFNPNGYLNNYYLFGNYNTTLRHVFLGIILGAIRAFKLKGRIDVRFCCMFLALLYFIVRVRSMTSIFGMAIFAVAILFYMARKKSGFFKFEYFFILSGVITIAVAVFGRFNIFEGFITSLLGKDMTLSNRTNIWARTILAIRKKPIWGYGQLSNDAVRNYLNGSLDPHNIFLGTLFYGGIIGLIVLAIILILVLRKIREGRKKCPQLAMIFDAGCCAYFLMWNFEPFAKISEFYKVLGFFVLACYCLNIAQSTKQNDKSRLV